MTNLRALVNGKQVLLAAVVGPRSLFPASLAPFHFETIQSIPPAVVWSTYVFTVIEILGGNWVKLFCVVTMPTDSVRVT
jgi:hypothetical protein